MTKFNALVADKDFVTKSGADVAKLQAAAKKTLASDKDLMVNIAEVEKLMAKPAAAADSAEAKGRSQLVNRNVLEILYSGDPRERGAGEDERRRVPHRRPGQDLEADDRVQAGDAAGADHPAGGHRGARPGGAGARGRNQAEARQPPAQAPARGPRPAARDARQRSLPAPAAQAAAGAPAGGRAAAAACRPAARRSTRPRAATTAASSSTRTTTRSSTAATPTRRCRSDSGKTFVVAPWDRGNGKTHVDHRVVWVDPLNSKHILSGNDGGSSETWDGGEHWRQSTHHQRPAVLRRVRGQRAALQHHGRHAGQRRVDGPVAEPQQLRHVQLRLDSTCRPATRSTSSATGGTPSTSTTRASSAGRAG